MKKYLMTGVAAMAMGMVLTSCSKNDADFTAPSQPTEYEKTLKQYDDAFAESFGTPATNQTWGFARATRSAQPNSNQWGTTDDNSKYIDYPTPAEITPEERAKVLAVFNEKGNESYTDLANLTNFFVQQVYCGVNGWKMNELACWDPAGYNNTIYPDWNNWQPTIVFSHDDIVNNFNGGKYSGNAEQGCMLMFNSSTSQWSFKTSQSGGERIYDHWRMEKIDGYYYVGFDHEAWRQAPANANEEDKRDFVYNDWIIKIVPGKGTVVPADELKEEGMVICEDMGNIGDFDFNDVVFYAKVWKSGKTEINLMAAGGTYDLTVAGVEVHEKFDAGKNNNGVWNMVNTGAGVTKEPIWFTATEKYNSLVEIPVVVNKKSAAGEVTSYALTAEIGKAPQKICVPLGFKWCKEYKSLAKVYPGFKAWTVGAANTWTGEYNANDVYNAN